MNVYHGTSVYKSKAIPIKHKRTQKGSDGRQYAIFEDISFHATPHYWIALAYTYSVNTFKYAGKEIYYNVSIDLYNENKEITIHGFQSLAQSLHALYKNGGYILTFSNIHFFHAKGLGTMELITQKILDTESINQIINPISSMKKQGIKFKFLDLTSPENRYRRNYVE